MKKIFFVLIFQSFICFSAFAATQLPLHTLRDQDGTSHCWAYAMSHSVESRALLREGISPLIHIERDIKYWVDFERLLFIYKTKGDFYFDDYSEGAWPIEYWEALLKHGFHIYKVAKEEPTITYPVNDSISDNLGFISYPRPPRPDDLPSVSEVKDKLKNEITTEAAALSYIRDYLTKLYGAPTYGTKWFNDDVNISETPGKLMGKDLPLNQPMNKKLDKMVMIVPASSGEFKWTRYLYDRYWGFRYEKSKIFNLIKMSLTNGFPVPFDNEAHARTIIGFAKTEKGTSYAIADSSPGSIYWEEESTISDDLIHLYFFSDGIPNTLPPKPESYSYQMDYDIIDHFQVPPGSRK